MGFTTIIALFILLIIGIAVYVIITGIRRKEWKRIVFPLVGLVLVLGGIYWALISFITSM